MIVVFTGPSSLNSEQEYEVVGKLGRMGAKASIRDVWRSGCAYGVDTVAAAQASLIDLVDLELYVPNAPCNGALIEGLQDDPNVKVVLCDPGRDPYRIRNEAMIKGPPVASKLVAFLKSDKFYRSGEWMTVNIAKGLNVPVEINVI